MVSNKSNKILLSLIKFDYLENGWGCLSESNWLICVDGFVLTPFKADLQEGSDCITDKNASKFKMGKYNDRRRLKFNEKPDSLTSNFMCRYWLLRLDFFSKSNKTIVQRMLNYLVDFYYYDVLRRKTHKWIFWWLQNCRGGPVLWRGKFARMQNISRLNLTNTTLSC